MKVTDISIREVWPFAFEGSTEALMWWLEMILGVVAPILILLSNKLRHSVAGLFTGASLVILGVVLNRINVFLVAYQPLYQEKAYFPTIWEIMVTVGFISMLVLLYRAEGAKPAVTSESYQTT